MKFKSQVYTAASGSIGGITYSHNRGGMYTRGRATPTDPNSARQALVRGVFNGLVVAWVSLLTDAERQGWRDYAAGVPYTNVFGDPLILTGQQMYIAANTPRVQAENSGLTTTLARVDTAPTILDRGENPLEPTVFTELAGAVTVSGDLGSAASDDGDALLFYGRPQNSSRAYYKGPYQLAAVAGVAADATGYNFSISDDTDPAEWQAEALPVIGQFVPLRIVMCYDDGRYTTAYRGIHEVIDGTP